MTRRVSRHGNTYTEGSSSAMAGWEPRICCICDQKIVHTKQAAQYHYNDLTGETLAWHSDCVGKAA